MDDCCCEKRYDCECECECECHRKPKTECCCEPDNNAWCTILILVVLYLLFCNKGKGGLFGGMF